MPTGFPCRHYIANEKNQKEVQSAVGPTIANARLTLRLVAGPLRAKELRRSVHPAGSTLDEVLANGVGGVEVRCAPDKPSGGVR